MGEPGWGAARGGAHSQIFFCMRCGPETHMEADAPAGLLRCPRCGDTAPLPLPPLFVLTGPSGAGKSTIAEGLRVRLPECLVFDGDVLLPLARGSWDEWRSAWLWLVYWIARNGRATVLCGSMVPGQLEALPARRLVGDIHYCNLDCPDDQLADRLRARPVWRGATVEFIEEQLPFARWLRANIRPTIDTGSLDVAQAADAVVEWVMEHLARR